MQALPCVVGTRIACDVKVRDILWLLRRDGWQLARQRGSHRQLRHPTKPGVVTVAGALHHDLHPKTASSIFRQAGFDEGALR